MWILFWASTEVGAVVWGVEPCRPIEIDRHFRGDYGLHHQSCEPEVMACCPDDGCSKHVSDFGQFALDYTAVNLRWQPCSARLDLSILYSSDALYKPLPFISLVDKLPALFMSYQRQLCKLPTFSLGPVMYTYSLYTVYIRYMYSLFLLRTVGHQHTFGFTGTSLNDLIINIKLLMMVTTYNEGIITIQHTWEDKGKSILLFSEQEHKKHRVFASLWFWLHTMVGLK